MARFIKIDVSRFLPVARTLPEIERDDLVRQTLEQAAIELEGQGGNPTYRMAWRVAAKILRKMKP
jgi:hypothetical protein